MFFILLSSRNTKFYLKKQTFADVHVGTLHKFMETFYYVLKHITTCNTLLKFYSSSNTKTTKNMYAYTYAYIQCAQVQLRLHSMLQEKEESLLSKLVDCSQLKYKERDELEQIIKYWCSDCQQPCEIARSRDDRLRQFYKERFDARLNLIDWDYVMNVFPYASIIHKIQYTDWRETGLLLHKPF
ncbi:hypothetical protein RFI_21967 [Reticulomyxa filosa]|uniref:Dynein assembly factor 3 C-terminal domain-containing protein n=1 Tax=Reticulomyxa filosa TaxID=46433 RepID=X6MPR7_RETFI|nr:hypothetical protein RFI_21967 [Reticulomyxa filosa]|eukprot:ETO15397.1 hypothetical protein RFI_21967 [Reticulomyxa filosa]